MHEARRVLEPWGGESINRMGNREVSQHGLDGQPRRLALHAHARDRPLRHLNRVPARQTGVLQLRHIFLHPGIRPPWGQRGELRRINQRGDALVRAQSPP
jgi:hypothetical protein